MTELSFLLELLLNHELQKITKEAITERIKVIEQNYTPTTHRPTVASPMPTSGMPPVPPQAIAQTPEAAKAIADLQNMRSEALNGSPGRTAPRKLGRQ